MSENVGCQTLMTDEVYERCSEVSDFLPLAIGKRISIDEYLSPGGSLDGGLG